MFLEITTTGQSKMSTDNAALLLKKAIDKLYCYEQIIVIGDGAR